MLVRVAPRTFVVAGLALATHARETPAQDTRRRLTDAQVRQQLIRESIEEYDGNCPCPYFTDARGRRCGGRSAWSRAGGAEPYCYPRDVPQEAVEAWRASHEATE